MGGKPRAEPANVEDLASCSDSIGLGKENYEVIRRVGADYPHQIFGMAITAFSEKRIQRGQNKGGYRVTLTMEYMDFDEKGNAITAKPDSHK